ncbi:hypothetical protein [Gemmiger formicilis]
MTPYYNKTSQAGLATAHFTCGGGRRSVCRCILYNVPPAARA